MGTLVPGHQGTAALGPGPRAIFYFYFYFFWREFIFFKAWMRLIFLMSHFQVSQDLDESFSSLSRLGWVIFKSLKTRMSHFQVSRDLDESLSSLSRLGWVTFKSLKTWMRSGGEGARQKILILQVFDRCVIVWGRQEGLCCIPHLPYPWGALGMVFQNRYFYLRKNLWKRRGNT
jgi:hypothetical protein